ncbi:MAG: Ig-like domain repeat protein [Thaumarchaeota archaeon]|nr:Ig-like domain repeat protein [Nitrososphaerota archaeon]
MSSSVYSVVNTKWFLPLLYFLGTVILLLRKPFDVLGLPARWEDVSALLGSAIQYSWGSIFVIHWYYFHLVPSLVTLFSLRIFGIANSLFVMNLVAIVIATLCAVFFATKQFRFIIKNDLLRAFCGLFVILVPGITEQIYSNISSIQWFLNIFVMLFVSLLLFRYDEFEKKSRTKKYQYSFFLSMSFLSSAFSVVFLPVLIYVIIREFRRKKNEIVTILCYVIPTALLFIQALTISISYLQEPKTSTSFTNDIFVSTVNSFTISAIKIFYHDTPNMFQHVGLWMYIVPVAIIAFVLLNSIKKEMKFEIYMLVIIAATLFFSSVLKNSLIDWNCLCGQAQERYFFLAMVFLFILVIRQFDKRQSLPFKLVFPVIALILVLNMASGFFIPVQADENWKYVVKFYNPSGKYNCYIGEIPYWSITIPCLEPISSNVTVATPNSQHGTSTGTLTFTPPIQSTMIYVTSSSSPVIYGQPVTFTATVTPTPNEGAVQFYVDGAQVNRPITIFGGQAVFTTSLLSVGTHKISASFSGDPNFSSSTLSNENTILIQIRAK